MSDPGSTPLVRVPRFQSLGGALTAGERVVAEETAVAFTYNGTTHAVMMATPADLEGHRQLDGHWSRQGTRRSVTRRPMPERPRR
jgi:hypothetical protein